MMSQRGDYMIGDRLREIQRRVRLYGELLARVRDDLRHM